MSDQTRLARRLAWVTAGGVGLMIVIALWQMPAIYSSRDNSSEVIKGNEMAACRSQVAGRVNRAMGDVLSTKAELDVLFASGLQAVVVDDDELLAALASLVPEASDRVTEAVSRHREALNAQQAANDLSRRNPSRFLAQCRKGD